ncbi:unnamed protein product [marine sediment metagenome]|uniref:Uncharacterized protein n=1 Tax=marine sediment metagenome TaxID=412755 RepID=X0YT37_9ZZZZ
MMLPRFSKAPTEFKGPKDLSRLWSQLYAQHYGQQVPGRDARGYWPRHYKAIGSLTEKLEEPVIVAAFFYWWFGMIREEVQGVFQVDGPEGLHGWVDRFNVFLGGNRGLIEELGPDKAIDYIAIALLPPQ